MKIADGLFLVGSGGFGLSHAFDCHVYAVDSGESVVMIDSGCGEEPERILANMVRDGLAPDRVKALLLTHAHLDHSGGAAFFKARLNCKVYVAAAEREILENGTEESTGLAAAKESGFYGPDYPVRHCGADIPLAGGEVLRHGSLQISVRSVPSHSRGSLCYVCDGLSVGRILFAGDVVFAEGLIDVLNIDGSSLAAYRRNLPSLDGLAVQALMPGHGLFSVSNGQRHIDMALRSLRRLGAPRNFI